VIGAFSGVFSQGPPTSSGGATLIVIGLCANTGPELSSKASTAPPTKAEVNAASRLDLLQRCVILFILSSRLESALTGCGGDRDPLAGGASGPALVAQRGILLLGCIAAGKSYAPSFTCGNGVTCDSDAGAADRALAYVLLILTTAGGGQKFPAAQPFYWPRSV